MSSNTDHADVMAPGVWDPHTFHISLFGLACLGAIFIGLAFSLILLLTKKGNKPANRILGLILLIMVMETLRASDNDIRLELPQFLLALGPLIYFYAGSIAKPDYKFRFRHLLHFCPA